MPFLKPFSLFIFLVLGLGNYGYSQKKEPLLTKKYSPVQLQEDATLLTNVLLAMHPAIGIYKPRAYYEILFKTYVTSFTDSLTEKQFRLRTKLLVDELHCGHTEVLYSSSFYKEMNKLKLNYSPYVFLPVDEKAYMIANLNKKQDSTIRKGSEIKKINGVTVDSMINYSKRFISTDGFNQSAKNYFVQLGFNSYYLGLFGRPDTFEVEYRENKILKSVKYPAIKLKTLPQLPLGPKEDSLLIKYRNSKIDYRFLNADKKTMFLKIEKFSHKLISELTDAFLENLEKIKLRI